MKVGLFLTLAVVVALASAFPAWKPSNGDIQVTPDTLFSFKVALQPQNVEYLDKLFWQISDPENPLYGRFLTHEQIADVISLPEQQIAQVESYLMNAAGKFCDVTVERSLHRDNLYVHTCVAQAKHILPNLDLLVYEKEDVNEKILRSKAVIDPAENLYFLGVPSEMHHLIAGIHDITDLPPHYEKFELPDPEKPWLNSDKQLSITEIIESFGVNMDNIAEASLSADHPQVRQAVVELVNSAFVASGLEMFQKKYHIRPDPVAKVVGHQEVTSGTIEADLDVQTITAMAQGAQTWSFAFNPSSSWADIAETIMATEGAPKVISVCWVNQVLGMTPSAVKAANIAIMKLGLAGFTWLNGSGDSGPVLNPENCGEFTSKFPSTSQYILSVGGVKIDAASGVEGAWFRTGGGFSEHFPRPAFQDELVEKYLESAQLPPNPQGSRYQTKGRATPDVSGFAAFYPMVYEGKFMAIGSGTSAATPQWAGILTLIQIQRYQKGLGPLGPVAPALYKLQKGVGFDVVSGQTYAIGRGYCVGDILPGFYATEGWDAATGLGTPKYDSLLEQLLTLGESK